MAGFEISWGTNVDVRKGKCRVRKVDYLDRGTIILVTDEGSSVHRPDGLGGVEELLTKAISSQES